MVGGWIADGFTGHDRRRCLRRARRLRRRRRADGGAQRARRRAPVPHRPGRDDLRPACRARRRPRRRGRPRARQGIFGLLVGSTGTTIIGVLALVIGTLLLSGASAGALVRRSGHAVRRAHTRARRARPLEHEPHRPAPVIPLRIGSSHRWTPCTTFRTSSARTQPPPLLVEPVSTEDPDQPSLFDVGTIGDHEEYTASGPRHPPPLAGRERGFRRRGGAHRRRARPNAQALRDRRDDQRPDLRSARDALRAAARAGHEGVESRRAEGRPLLCAGDDGDPHPRADTRASRRSGSRCRTSRRTSSRSATSSTTCPRRRARWRSGSGRTSRAPRSGPTSRACRTC